MGGRRVHEADPEARLPGLLAAYSRHRSNRAHGGSACGLHGLVERPDGAGAGAQWDVAADDARQPRQLRYEFRQLRPEPLAKPRHPRLWRGPTDDTWRLHWRWNVRKLAHHG